MKTCRGGTNQRFILHDAALVFNRIQNVIGVIIETKMFLAASELSSQHRVLPHDYNIQILFSHNYSRFPEARGGGTQVVADFLC
jgi:hypothetical protein